MKPNPGRLILIVEDEKDALHILSEALAKNGYRVQTAPDLATARSLLQKGLPDLLILDRNLPDGDGLDLCKEIRNHPQHAGLPILFLSIRNKTEEVVHGLKSGADDYLPKPFGIEELKARVEAILRRSYPAESDLPPRDSQGNQRR